MLFALQADSGAFGAVVQNIAGEFSSPDHNGFVTALVLREMEGFADSECEEPLKRALDFLEECESPSGMFSFWPPRRIPPWAPYNPDECDTTAVIAGELFAFSRIPTEKVRRIALDLMPEFQTGAGQFLAWRSRDVVPTPFDIALNMNVVAFLAQTGYRDSAPYGDACRAIRDAVASCEGTPQGLDRLTPYYPEITEVRAVLDHALRRGATELLPVAALFEAPPVPTGTENAGVLFANEGRRTVWSSEAVRVARQIRRVAQFR
jgi:hypothetical protein